MFYAKIAYSKSSIYFIFYSFLFIHKKSIQLFSYFSILDIIIFIMEN